MEIKNPNKKSIYSTQNNYFKNLNPSADEFKERIKDGSYQRDPERYNYEASREAAKAKNIYK
ncbi:hypothetical protein EAI30_03710 [Romboutsia ilealis]|uniref:Uncharacterized protein n=1 Tax=Romboutsia faecis TaxID=2764597 RepID=A0ABR7JKT3_9FIRM|nr:hypothetical protein [Romboutsia faecis]MBC5995519.1 hypothetical protein [Romboutsia faecis]MDU2198702.1 hypothetical protein [Peptostreptococcaceae bacterium]MRN23719.1 hypothetical protein [Romboutsia ilealis]